MGSPRLESVRRAGPGAHRVGGVPGPGCGGRGQVVGIVGEPGVGKSRLIYEVTRALPAAGWHIFDSRAVVYGQATPYRPVIDLVKAYCHVAECEVVQVTRQKVLDSLA